MRSMVEGAFRKGCAVAQAPPSSGLTPPRAGEDQWKDRSICRPVPRRTNVASA